MTKKRTNTVPRILFFLGGIRRLLVRLPLVRDLGRIHEGSSIILFVGVLRRTGQEFPTTLVIIVIAGFLLGLRLFAAVERSIVFRAVQTRCRFAVLFVRRVVAIGGGAAMASMVGQPFRSRLDQGRRVDKATVMLEEEGVVLQEELRAIYGTILVHRTVAGSHHVKGGGHGLLEMLLGLLLFHFTLVLMLVGVILLGHFLASRVERIQCCMVGDTQDGVGVVSLHGWEEGCCSGGTGKQTSGA